MSAARHSGTAAGPLRPLRPWVLSLAGLLLVGFNLRAAVAAIPPYLNPMSRDLAMSPTEVGLLGALPAMCFALIGPLLPRLSRRLGLERVVTVACAVVLIGQTARVLAPDTATFLGLSVVTYAGIALANVAVPPLVKRWYPGQVARVSGLVALALAVGATCPPLLAVWLHDPVLWRVWVGGWAIAVAPALALWWWLGARAGGRGAVVEEPSAPIPRRWRRGDLVAITAVFGIPVLNQYAILTWMPVWLHDAGVPNTTIAALLALYAAVGLPMTLLVPALMRRTAMWRPLGTAMTLAMIVGLLGFWLSPAGGSAVWAVFAGISQGLFTLSISLIALRGRDPEETAHLSGMVQGGAYALAWTGPLIVGGLNAFTSRWQEGQLALVASMIVAMIAVPRACRPEPISRPSILAPNTTTTAGRSVRGRGDAPEPTGREPR